MTRHLADHETPSLKDGLRQFRRIARQDRVEVWKVLWRKGTVQPSDRRVMEYARIDRGRWV